MDTLRPCSLDYQLSTTSCSVLEISIRDKIDEIFLPHTTSFPTEVAELVCGFHCVTLLILNQIRMSTFTHFALAETKCCSISSI